MRLGLDIDGVIYAWDKQACKLLSTLKGYRYESLHPSQTWTWIKDNITPEDWEWLWKEEQMISLFLCGSLFPGTKDALQKLSKDHTLVALTHRPTKAKEATYLWIGKENLPFDEVHILSGYRGQSKLKSQVKCDLYLDDKPENVRDTSMIAPSYLWTRAYNKDFSWERRVTSWEEFIQHVEWL